MPRSYGITNAAPYASAPAVGAAGDTYFNTTSKLLFVSDGTSWIQATGSVGVSADANNASRLGSDNLIYTPAPGLWQSYTPVLRRNDTLAVLPSSGAIGRYCRIGNAVLCWGQIVSTNDAPAGVGSAVDLPVAANQRILECGVMVATALTAADTSATFARMSDSTGARIVLHNYASGGFRGAAAGATIYWNVMYEVV